MAKRGSGGKEQRRDWYELDLSAIVYPTLQRRDFSSVYRLSVVLKEEIRPQVLQKALDMTLPRFPTYKAAIRKGLFWRYLEPNNRPGPFVQEDVKNPCQPMYFKANNRYLVRVYYFRNRIALEAHHSLGDGTGGMCVLLTMTATYLRLLGVEGIENQGFVLDIHGEPDPGELEDAYMRYANAKVCPPRLEEKAYRVRGTAEPFYTLNIVDGIMSVSEVLTAAKRYHDGEISCHYYGVSECGSAVRPAEESGGESKRQAAPGKDCYACEPEAFFPVHNLAEFHHHDLSGGRSEAGGIHI